MKVKININRKINSASYRIDNCLIDPGDIWEAFQGVDVVLLTHSHFDHIYGLNDLFNVSPCMKVYTNCIGREMLFNAKKNLSFFHGSPFEYLHPDSVCVIEDRQEIMLKSGVVAKAFFTPGHNASCITWKIDNMLFTGDSYIPGLKTVTKLPGGNKQQALKSESYIKGIISDEILVYPGHLVM